MSAVAEHAHVLPTVHHPSTLLILSARLETDTCDLTAIRREKTNIAARTIAHSPHEGNRKLMRSGRALMTASEHTLWLQLPTFDKSKLALTSPR